MNNKFKNAFSIIEISIVILVMGILISGVSKGIDLYQDYNLEVARNLTRNSIVSRLDNVRLWYETTLDESFVNRENKNNNPITIWQDIKKNQFQNEKYHAYCAQRSNSTLPTYEKNSIANVSGPKYIRDGINGLPTLNFFNERSSSISQFMVIDSNYKFEIDDYNIYIVFELNKLLPYSTSFLIHSPLNGYSGNSGISIAFYNYRLNTQIGYTNPSGGFSFVFYHDFDILQANKNYLLEMSLKFSNNSYYIKMNGKTIKSGTVYNPLFNLLRHYQFKIGRNYHWNGLIGEPTSTDSDFNLSEFIITNGETTINQKKQIEEYLMKKFDIKG